MENKNHDDFVDVELTEDETKALGCIALVPELTNMSVHEFYSFLNRPYIKQSLMVGWNDLKRR